MPIRVLSASDVRASLPMPAAIDAMRAAFGELSAGRADLPRRMAVPIPNGDAVLLVMPGRCDVPLGLGGKFVSVFPQNRERALPLVHAAVLLLHPATGEPYALLEGRALTAIRTGAASGLATELLARSDAKRVAIIGAGVQARTQLEAIACVRDLEEVFVYSRTRTHAERFAEEMAGRGSIPDRVSARESAREACRRADIVCLATTSSTPVVRADEVAAGSHINAVGSYAAGMVELDPTVVARARVFVDQRAAAIAEAGEIIAALDRGLIQATDLVELGEVVNQVAVGRRVTEEITVFKSVGVATQDLCAAGRAVLEAERTGLGVVNDF